MVAEQLCRNGKHPIDFRITNRDGRTTCQGCHDERETTRATAGLNRMGIWQTPVHDEARAQALKVWVAGVDAAIEEIRRTEGFDGKHQTWQTLGECLAPDPTPAPYAPPTRPAVLRFPPRPGAMRYVSNGTMAARTARFQAMAAEDAGRLAYP